MSARCYLTLATSCKLPFFDQSLQGLVRGKSVIPKGLAAVLERFTSIVKSLHRYFCTRVYVSLS